MRRAWSIRARTALAFALTSMALTAAAIVVVNIGSQHSIAEVTELSETLPEPMLHPTPAVRPDPSSPPPTERIAIVSRVATSQWQWSVLGIGAAGVLSGGTGWLLSRRMLAPIDAITATATRISASTLHERIALEGPDDELRRVSRTIDGLLDRLEQAFESQRRFVAQASHELRTPLAVQRAAIQIGLHDGARPTEIACAREDLLEQNRRTEHLVESLLVLAEAERGLDGRTVAVDLGALVDEVVAELSDTATAAGVTVTCRRASGPPGGTPITVDCEPVLTRQLVHNLVDNAIEYNHAGGDVRVTVDGTGLRVENTGDPLPAEVVATLTEPFRRADGVTGAGTGRGVGVPVARRHSGLGLSIVDAVAQAHGWCVEVTPRGGGGLVVSVGTRAR
ncbi:HAMP domain-containing sensor histidine kinase [Curtobacterium sp. MCSS17_015]|uniref:sensor histidine kinase n=1 Tax=Curtobacterium sp. MCSS17_015 TaxID=2175666 RepID=UPI000DA967F0|nr:HAMP domain-containing sensor histidine kinase [Curtobacterium sp. MCSS17_015]WIB26947.1 HAMP domain-containing sensor histidine kinase [Curtobacterium sp. MCSS17_015]